MRYLIPWFYFIFYFWDRFLVCMTSTQRMLNSIMSPVTESMLKCIWLFRGNLTILRLKFPLSSIPFRVYAFNFFFLHLIRCINDNVCRKHMYITVVKLYGCSLAIISNISQSFAFRKTDNPILAHLLLFQWWSVERKCTSFRICYLYWHSIYGQLVDL